MFTYSLSSEKRIVRYSAYFLALTVLVGGCAHSRLFNPATPEGRAEVNARAEKHPTIVFLTNGERMDVESLRLNATEASWINPRTGEARSVLLSEIRTVRVPNRGRGALEGMAIGAGIAAGIGILGILIEGEGGGPSLGAPSTELVFVGGTVSGAAIGALVGVATGRTFYESEPAHGPSTTLNPIPSSQNALLLKQHYSLSVPQSTFWNWETATQRE